MQFINAVKETLNPRGGGGVGETIIVLAVIISITVLSLYGREIPPAMMILVSAIGGIIAGYKVGGNTKKIEKIERENAEDEL